MVKRMIKLHEKNSVKNLSHLGHTNGANEAAEIRSRDLKRIEQ